MSKPNRPNPADLPLTSVPVRPRSDGDSITFGEAVKRLAGDLITDSLGTPREPLPPLMAERLGGDPKAEERDAAAKAKLQDTSRQAEWRAFKDKLAAERAGWEARARPNDGGRQLSGR